MTVRQGAGPHERAVVTAWHAGTQNEVQLTKGLDDAARLSKRQAGFETSNGKYDREAVSAPLIDGLNLDSLAQNPRDAQAFLAELGDIELARGALNVLRTTDRDDYWNNARFRKLQEGTQEVGFCRESVSLGLLIKGRRTDLAAADNGTRGHSDPLTTTVGLGRLGR